MSMLIVDLDAFTEEVEKALGDLKDETPKVLRSALSTTARKVRKQVVAEAKSRYAYQDSGEWANSNKGAIKLKAKTKRDAFYTRLVSTGPMNELLDFMVSPAAYAPRSRPDAIKAKVLSAGALKILGDTPKPFITKFKSGHIAVVRRTGKKRLPVKSLLSPSVPSMVKNAGMVETAQELMATELPVQIRKAVQRTLRKAGKA